MAPAENNADSLLVRARQAAERANCPYSNFHVGAAMPCGACRQVMQELLPNKANVSIDDVSTRQIEQLLPAPFEMKQPNIN